MMKKKGFTLIEILIAVAILGVLSTVVIAAISGYIKTSKENYDNELENSFLLTGKTYYSNNREKLPEDGQGTTVTLGELRSLNLTNKDYVDAYGNICSNDDSKVMVINEDGNYKYTACLYCENSSKFDQNHTEQCDPINLSEPPIEPPVPKCQIETENNKYIVYDDKGNFYEKTNGIDAVTELIKTCDIKKDECAENIYTLGDGSKIKYFYGNDGEIYENEDAAQKKGACTKTTCKIETENNKFVVYDKSGKSTTKKTVISALNELIKTCDIEKDECAENIYTLGDGSKIKYFYGNDGKIYKDETTAQEEGVCRKCQIVKENNKFVVYDDKGNSTTKSSGIAAVTELGKTCKINKEKCKAFKQTVVNGSEISYFYGSDKKIYKDKAAAQKNGVCEKVCTSYKLNGSYPSGVDSTYKKVISSTSSITKNSQLSKVFNNPVKTFKEGKSYYLYYVKKTSYDDILAASSSTSSEKATAGKTSSLDEYFNPSTKAKVTKSKLAKVHHNKAIPDEYELLLSKSATNSQVNIPNDLKMSQKDINKWGTDFSKYAKYGRVVLAKKGAANNYKVRYSNVGTYQGQKVDVIMTLTGFSGCELKDGASKCGIWFEPKVLHIYSLGVKRINVKYEFFKAGTGTKISVKGYSTYWDIDANQGIHFLQGTTGIYSYGANELYVSNLNKAPYVFEYNDKLYSGYDQRGSITETFSGKTLYKVFTFMSGKDGDHSKVTSSHGAIEPSTIPIGVSKEYYGSVNSESVLKAGDTVQFIIRYSNISSKEQKLTITDNLTNMTYVNGSAKILNKTKQNPKVNGGKLTWTRTVPAHSYGYLVYKAKVKDCGKLAYSYASLKSGTSTFKSRTLKNLVMCSKKVGTTCAKWETT